MKSLYNKKDNEEIIARINTLTHNSQAVWGKMNVAKMLSHCIVGLKGAFGEILFKRGLIAILFGKMAKKTLTHEKPFKRGLPTDKAFIIVEEKNFEQEKQLLIEYVKRFVDNGKQKITKEPHPFFGKLTLEEWDILQWKHLDHHLRQFGA